MYEGSVAGGAGAGVATLPVTGLSIGWQVVLAATLIMGGFALIRLSPRLRRQH